jgi:pyridoxine/pyridoxamine 5'-phosphate oxidase
MGTVENGALSDEGLSAYERTLEWLYGLRAAKGMDFKLDRMIKVLRQLGDPHHAFPAIHVAGTNGKGSVAAMLHSILTCAGYRVGIYVSPHLVRFTERIRVGREEVTPDTVVRLAGEVRAASENVGVEPTFFELVTLMAFLHFARSPVDVAALFHWDALGRQIRLEGRAVRSPEPESDAYFSSRDWGSQLGAWGSDQSAAIESRQALIRQIRQRADALGIELGETTDTLRNDIRPRIRRPPHWGGYRLWITSIELWIEGPDRLHERALWTRDIVRRTEDSFSATPWTGKRLQP